MDCIIFHSVHLYALNTKNFLFLKIGFCLYFQSLLTMNYARINNNCSMRIRPYNRKRICEIIMPINNLIYLFAFRRFIFAVDPIFFFWDGIKSIHDFAALFISRLYDRFNKKNFIGSIRSITEIRFSFIFMISSQYVMPQYN